MKGLRGTPGVLLVLLVIIWVGLPLIPEDTGLRFGSGYQAYVTVMLTLSGLFFWLLGADRIPSPRSAFGVTATLTAVLLVTIGALVGAGMAYPQFDLPDPPGTEQASSAPERGEALFLSQQIGCGAGCGCTPGAPAVGLIFFGLMGLRFIGSSRRKRNGG